MIEAWGSGQTPVSSGASTPTNGSTFTPANIILTPGLWLVGVRAGITYSSAPTITVLSVGLGTALNDIGDSNITPIAVSSGIVLNAVLTPAFSFYWPYYVPPGTTLQLYGGAYSNFSGGTGLTLNVSMFAASMGQ